MARFQQRINLSDAQMDTSRADVSRQLASTLRNFSDRIGDERREIVARESLSEGIEAGFYGEQPKKSEFSLANKAFNRGLRAAYIADMGKDIRENVARITLENETDPIAFENAALAWERETLNGIEDDELRVGIQQKIRAATSQSYSDIAQAAALRVKEENLATTNLEISQLAIEAERLGFDDNIDESANKVLEAMALIDEQVESGLKGFSEGQNEKIKLQKNVDMQRLAGQTWRNFQSFDSFDDALKILSTEKPPKNVTMQEWRTMQTTIESDLREKLATEQLDEANQAKLSDEQQNANYRNMLADLATGELAPDDVRLAISTGDINGEQAQLLNSKFGSVGRGIDDPAVLNQVELDIAQGRLSTAMNTVVNNMGQNMTDATAQGYLRRLAEHGDPSSVLNDPNVKRYQKHLKTFIGYKDAMSGFFDPAMQQRWGRAILEYENAVLAGADPETTMFNLVNDFTNPTERFESMRNPTTADNKDDLTGALKRLKTQFEKGIISEVDFNREAAYILDELIPAKQEAQAWDLMINNNSKMNKAEGK